MKKILFVVVSSLMLPTGAFAQSLSFNGVTLGSDDFTSNNGSIQLALPTTGINYFSDLNTQLKLSDSTATALGFDSAGWIFNTSVGEVVVTIPGEASVSGAVDPAAAYGYYAINNTGGTAGFSVSMTTDLPPTSFPGGATSIQSFALTLTSSTGSLVSGSATQTSTLSGPSVPNYVAGTPIYLSPTPTTGSSSASSNPPIESIIPPDIYNELTISAAGTYSAGAIVSLTGRVDVEDAPEPSTAAMFSVVGICALVFNLRRRRMA